MDFGNLLCIQNVTVTKKSSASFCYPTQRILRHIFFANMTQQLLNIYYLIESFQAWLNRTTSSHLAKIAQHTAQTLTCASTRHQRRQRIYSITQIFTYPQLYELIEETNRSIGIQLLPCALFVAWLYLALIFTFLQLWLPGQVREFTCTQIYTKREG